MKLNGDYVPHDICREKASNYLTVWRDEKLLASAECWVTDKENDSVTFLNFDI